MENYAVQQFRRSSSSSFSANQDSSRHADQLMYPYASFAQQQSQTQAAHSQAQPQPQQSQPQQQRRPSLSQLQTQQHSRSTPQFNAWSMHDHAHGYPQFSNGMLGKHDDAQLQESCAPHQQAISAQSFGGLLAHDPLLQSDMFSGSLLDANTVASTVGDFDLSRLTGPWNQQKAEDMEFPNLDTDISEYNTHLVSSDEDCPTIIDLRRFSTLDADQDNTDSRRQSESYSVSSAGPVADIPNFDDTSASEQPHYGSDQDTWSEMPTNPPSSISPSESPRRGHDAVIRTGNRTRASPISHNMRTSPYTLESNRLKRWSTGTQMPVVTPPVSRPMSQFNDRFPQFGGPFAQHHLQHFQQPSMGAYPMHSQGMMYPQGHSNALLRPSQSYSLEIPRPVPSQGMFPLLHSNAHRHGGCSAHFADLSDPPDLYSSLHEEPSDPPEADMHPDDPDMVPHEQDLRFTGDLYTPRWVRGHGNKREGWCGLCKPGRWLVLKNSAFWYDKSFTHGVSAATGAAFQGPQETRRTEGNLDVWEGLCGSCGEWIALVSSKKKGTTWFRHAYKCHTHPKVKDGPKRRRETSHQIRARTVSSASTTSIPYPMSKESSHDPMPRHERLSISEEDPDHVSGVENNRSNLSVPARDEKPQYNAHELVGLGGVKSILASMI